MTEEQAVLREIPMKARYALDLGTGTGRFAFLCAERCQFAIGVDVRIDGLHIAERRTCPGGHVAFAVMEGAALGLRSASLDVVTAVGTFECTRDLKPILREIARVLVPEGNVVFTCWNEERWPKAKLLDRRAPGAVLWSAEDVRMQTEQCGLTIESMESIFFMPRRLLWWLYGALLLQPLRRLLVVATASLEGRLAQINSWAMAGRVLIVSAKKAGSDERAYHHR